MFYSFFIFWMKKFNSVIKGFFSFLLIWCLFSVSYAITTQEWRDLVDQLKDEWRTNEEIRVMLNEIWLNADNYISKSTSSSQTWQTTQKWREIIEQLKKNWRTEKEIEKKMINMWVDVSWYFWNSSSSSSLSNSETRYTSRNCKVYNIEYISNLWVYTSSNFKRKEYFINSDYLRRYIDSKNPHTGSCPTNEWRISNFYEDNSNSYDRFIAPNWKVYFIVNQNWSYTSNELSSTRSFSTINELKNYIKTRNPLIWMWDSSWISTNANNTIAKMRSEIFN